MNSASPDHGPSLPIWFKITSVIAFVFGVMTLFSAGGVLFGPTATQEMAGAYVEFVVWFNFAAGFFYIVAAIGIWTQREWDYLLSGFIALATVFMAIPFAFHVIAGEPFELRTVGALFFRIGFWTAIAIALHQSKRNAHI
ncbi:hypothetical protein MXMO3_03526 (plasmid) [Maritalea myrionectae]|uniref:Uncharacterized protein n=1 Tax=Maritalea myrionectae TaxID=454601 RepID=A0A2R4MJ55_9HYPH|nr:hypothetical protein [Maritalea myrionectae]AVX06029.1 hypothetical protein MXMO3_03526 [Maritalea myrionectae]